MNPTLPAAIRAPEANRSSRASVNRLGGFSMIEVMVSMTILMILTLLCVKVFEMMSGAWSIQQSRSDTVANGRAALDFMVSEIVSASSPANDNRYTTTNGLTTWHVDNSTATTVTNTITDDDSYADQLYFVAPLGSNTEPTDLAEVGYFISFDANSKGYSLNRRFTPYSNSANWNIWNTNSASLAPQAAWYNTPVRASSPLNAMLNNGTNAVPLANNVWSLRVRCFDATGAYVEGWYNTPTNPHQPNNPPTNPHQPKKLPTSVTVEVKVYSDETAGKLKQLYGSLSASAEPRTQTGPTPPNWWDVIRQDAHTFTQTVYLLNASSN